MCTSIQMVYLFITSLKLYGFRLYFSQPYTTMEYARGVMPAIASYIVSEDPVIDGTAKLMCGKLDPHGRGVLKHSESVQVNQDVELHFPQSDFTYLAFFSRPVHVQCYRNEGAPSIPGVDDTYTEYVNPSAFQLRVNDDIIADDDDEHDPLIVRLALANNCTMGTNVNFCHQNQPSNQSDFMSILRDHADVYPTSPKVQYAFSNPIGGLMPESPDGKSAFLLFDWAAKNFGQSAAKDAEADAGDSSQKGLIMFALPHHLDSLREVDGKVNTRVLDGHCANSLHGHACLVEGGLWAMEEGKMALLDIFSSAHIISTQLLLYLQNSVGYQALLPIVHQVTMPSRPWRKL